MKKLIFTVATLLSALLISCEKKELKPLTPQVENPSPIVSVPLSGHYSWSFEIPGIGNQESHLVFYKDSIGYVMNGSAYSTNYMMIQESYVETNQEKRWIGVGKGGSINKDGKFFVLFFKDITASSVSIYKRECESKLDAENFAYPEPNATADHGWNVYTK